MNFLVFVLVKSPLVAGLDIHVTKRHHRGSLSSGVNLVLKVSTSRSSVSSGHVLDTDLKIASMRPVLKKGLHVCNNSKQSPEAFHSGGMGSGKHSFMAIGKTQLNYSDVIFCMDICSCLKDGL